MKCIAPEFQSFYSEINYYYEGFSFKWNLHFSLSAFNTPYLLYILSVLTILFHVDFFWSCLFCVLCASWICMDMFFLSLGKFSFIDVVKDFIYPGDLWFFLSSIFISILAFFMLSHISCMFPSVLLKFLMFLAYLV